MFFSRNVTSYLLGAAAGIVVQQPITVAQIDQQVATTVKAVTVIINGQNPGSGVILGKEDNTYFVLTAKHVLPRQDEYEIITPDGQKYPLDYNKVRKLPDMDLAVAQFTSNQNYPIATISPTIPAEGMTIHIAGWPHPGEAITQRVFQLTSGEISGLSTGALDDGYELIYTNITRSGMSGGGIFNDLGHLIGIHGRAEGKAIYDPDTGDSINVKAGFNLGIPITTFIDVTDPASLSYNASFAVTTGILGILSLQQNQLQDAISYLQKAAQLNQLLQLQDNAVLVFTALGQAKYEMGEIQSAIDYFEKAIAIDPEKVTPSIAIGMILYTQQGQKREGLRIVSKGIEQAMNKPNYLQLLDPNRQYNFSYGLHTIKQTTWVIPHFFEIGYITQGIWSNSLYREMDAFLRNYFHPNQILTHDLPSIPDSEFRVMDIDTKSFKIWNLRSEQTIQNDNILVAEEDDIIKFSDIDSGETLFILKAVSPNYIGFSSDGQFLITAYGRSGDNNIILWSLPEL